jgi:pyruvate ferredoxin oxidoreductase gamma subunit
VKGKTIEIRWHGRGGQGVVTASKLLAETALEEGKHFQGMPDYGAERMGAPIVAYTRISSEPIRPYCMVTEPDVVVVLDPSLLDIMDVTAGMKKDGKLIVNTSLSPQEVKSRTNYEGEVWTADATKISMEFLKRNLPNTPMLGALARATGMVGKEALVKRLKERFGAKLKASVVEANVAALEKAYEQVEGG